MAPGQFRRVTAGNTGYAATTTVSSHNQTSAVAIQLGLIGAVVLWAMWLAHLFLFSGRGVVAWLGLVAWSRTSSPQSLTPICSISTMAGYTSSPSACWAGRY